MRESAQTHCSTPSREPQPRRCRTCRRVSWSDALPPAPRWPPPSWELRREGGQPAPPRPASPALRRSAKMAAAALTREGGEDAFRRLFRFYRQRDVSDLRGVVDFSVPGGQVTLGSSCPRRAAIRARPALPAVRRRFGAVLWRCCCSPRSPPAASPRARRHVSHAVPLRAIRCC